MDVLIRQYFQQLTAGCGRSGCASEGCASNPAVAALGPNEAAAAAILAVQRHASGSPSLCAGLESAPDSTMAEALPAEPAAEPEPPEDPLAPERIEAMVAECRASDFYRPLIHLAGEVFSDQDKLNVAFPVAASAAAAAVALSPVAAADLGSLDPDEAAAAVDADAALRTYGALLGAGSQGVCNALKNNMESLAYQLEYAARYCSTPRSVRVFAVLLLHPGLLDPEFVVPFMERLVKALYAVPESGQLTLMRWWATLEDYQLAGLVAVAQQFVARLGEDYARGGMFYRVLPGLHLLRMLRRAAGDALPAACFYNDFLNKKLSDDFFARDCAIFQALREQREGGDAGGEVEGTTQALCDFPFLLDAASKATALRLDAQLQMEWTVRRGLMQMGQSPYLVLHVRRSEIVSDTLQQMAQMTSQHFKKPLKVKFRGEEGVDEGGVRKEFFQVILRSLLDPQFAMFVEHADARCLWFNAHSFESNMEYELIGSLVGLAIYNAVILDLRFPLAVYKKLLGLPLSVEDLATVRPEEARSLQQLLEYEGDVEAALGLCFEVSYEAYGELCTAELCPGGASMPVTGANRHEYVRLLVQYYLSTSIEAQFAAFSRGFLAVCGGAVLQMCSAEELELIVCGSPELDFAALETAARYDGFEDPESDPTVAAFWRVVHAFDETQKRALLKFATGSDRVPVNGLAAMRFVIVKSSDVEQLPTSHTCFNSLVLPEYADEAVLREKLVYAIEHAEGFGLL